MSNVVEIVLLKEMQYVFKKYSTILRMKIIHFNIYAWYFMEITYLIIIRYIIYRLPKIFLFYNLNVLNIFDVQYSVPN